MLGKTVKNKILTSFENEFMKIKFVHDIHLDNYLIASLMPLF